MDAMTIAIPCKKPRDGEVRVPTQLTAHVSTMAMAVAYVLSTLSASINSNRNENKQSGKQECFAHCVASCALYMPRPETCVAMVDLGVMGVRWRAHI